MRLKKQLALVALDLNMFPLGYNGDPIKVSTPLCSALSKPVALVLRDIYECNCFDGAAINEFFDRISDLLNQIELGKESSLDFRSLMYCLDKLILVDRVLQRFGQEEARETAEGTRDALDRQESLDSGCCIPTLARVASLGPEDDYICFEEEDSEEEGVSEASRSADSSDNEGSGFGVDDDGMESELVSHVDTEEENEDQLSVSGTDASSEDEEEEDEKNSDFDTDSSSSFRIAVWICKLLGVSGSTEILLQNPLDFQKMVTAATRLEDSESMLTAQQKQLVVYLQGKMTQAVRVKPDRDADDLQRERVVSLLAMCCGIPDLVPVAVQLQETHFGNVMVQPKLESSAVNTDYVRGVFAKGNVDLIAFQKLSLLCLFLGVHDGQAKNFFVAEPLEEGGKLRIGMTDRKGCSMERDTLHSTIQIGDQEPGLPIAFEFLAWNLGCDAVISSETWASFKQGVQDFLPIFKSLDPVSASHLESVFLQMSDAVEKVSVSGADSLTVSSLTHTMYPMMFLATGIRVYVENQNTKSMAVALVKYIDLIQQSINSVALHLFDRLNSEELKLLFDHPDLQSLHLTSVPQLVSYCLTVATQGKRAYSPTSALTRTLQNIYEKLNPTERPGPRSDSAESEILLSRLRLVVKAELSVILHSGCDAEISSETWASFKQGVQDFLSIFKSLDPVSASHLKSVFLQMSDAVEKVSVSGTDSLPDSSLTHTMSPMMYLATGFRAYVENQNTKSMATASGNYFDLIQQPINRIVLHLFDRLNSEEVKLLFDRPDLQLLHLTSVPQLVSYCLTGAQGKGAYSPTSDLTCALEQIYKKLNPTGGPGPLAGSSESVGLLSRLSSIVKAELSVIPESQRVKIDFCREAHSY